MTVAALFGEFSDGNCMRAGAHAVEVGRKNRKRIKEIAEVAAVGHVQNVEKLFLLAIWAFFTYSAEIFCGAAKEEPVQKTVSFHIPLS